MLAQAGPEVAAKCALAICWRLRSRCRRLLFSAYRGFNTAVSRPKAVMALQVCALLLKVPLSALP